MHGPQPSLDLEGGQKAPIARRPSALATPRPRVFPSDPSPKTSSSPLPSPSLSPLTGSFASSLPPPRPFRPESPPSDLSSSIPPPSPPRSGARRAPAPLNGSTFEAMQKSWVLTPASQSYPPTPPLSTPSSVIIDSGDDFVRERAGQWGGEEDEDDSHADGNGFGASDAASAEHATPGEPALSPHDASYRAKRRPSFIITTAPTEENIYGLAIGFDGEPNSISVSPRLRRQYPIEASLASPTSPDDGEFTSPLSSPTFVTSPFLSPSIPSPTLSASTPMSREPSSPRFATFTEPIARLVRRASAQSLNAQLPTSVSRSASPSRSPIPSPSLSPLLGSTKRGSFAAQARGRDREKEKELEIAERQRQSKKVHNRMFSWAERPGDKAAVSDAQGAIKKRIVRVFLVVAAIGLLVIWRSSRTAPPPKPSRVHPPRTMRSRVPGAGLTFIHPDVLERKSPPSKGRFAVTWRWIKSALVIDQPALPPRYNPGAITRTRGNASPKPPTPDSKTKRPSVFVPSRPVTYSTPHPLPPSPVHSDAPERDTLVLYRILGNDLPPRHSPGQTLRNLRFLLQRESDFSTLPHIGPHAVHHARSYGSGSGTKQAHSDGGGLRVDKYFVLNRIAEPEMVSTILGLLKRYSVPSSRILHIPFQWDEYQRRDFRWDGGVDALLGWGIGPQDETAKARAALAALDPTAEGWEAQQERRRKGDKLARLRALDFTYHEKNLYAMNNNGGRNFALKHGRSLPHARWILPLDGNSFFTPVAMHSIVTTLSIAGEGDLAARYVIIPMARLIDNEALLRNNSIALVPHPTPHDGASAAQDAERLHRPDAAPSTPEEPQVGFRYDSTESFQEAMRYGRRSKLELLWRLGAIPYSRGLDHRTLPWEQSDREHVTAESWGSIPGVEGTDMSSIVHRAHGDVLNPSIPDPPRGPLAFAKAGWVYRLFSGDQNQELHSQEAIALRNTNRIKGIVAFLERLDEEVSRGAAGCGAEPGACGFTPQRFWSFETEDVERLRQQYKAGLGPAVARVERYEATVYGVHAAVRQSFSNPDTLTTADPTEVAMNATLLAMAGYLTSNSSYSTLAADLIQARFVSQVPIFFRVGAQREQLRKYGAGQPHVGTTPIDISNFNGPGYAFPAPPSEENEAISWSAAMGHHLEGASIPTLPFDPLQFDPILLMDAVRLLSSPNAPKSDFAVPDSRKAVMNIFTTQLSYLLFSPVATAYSRDPPSAKAGAHFDAKLAALAAFVDDTRLFVRVANRARLRLSPGHRVEGLLHPSKEVREVHYRLIQGVARTRLVPYNLAADPLSDGMYHTLEHGHDSPFDVLGV